MVVVNGLLLAGLLLPLMVQHLISPLHGVGSLLVHIPGRILDELGHMLQVDLLHTVL